MIYLLFITCLHGFWKWELFFYIFCYVGLGGAYPILVSNFVVLYFCFSLCIVCLLASILYCFEPNAKWLPFNYLS